MTTVLNKARAELLKPALPPMVKQNLSGGYVIIQMPRRRSVTGPGRV